MCKAAIDLDDLAAELTRLTINADMAADMAELRAT